MGWLIINLSRQREDTGRGVGDDSMPACAMIIPKKEPPIMTTGGS
jgi:hypothetical protein